MPLRRPTRCTPASWSPGAEIQATIFDNIASGLFIVDGRALRLADCLHRLRRPARCRRRLALDRMADGGRLERSPSLLLCRRAILLLRFGHVFVSPLAPGRWPIVAVAVGQSAPRLRRGAAQRRDITRAFSQYLSPVLVERLADDPSQLKLGGERRTLTDPVLRRARLHHHLRSAEGRSGAADRADQPAADAAVRRRARRRRHDRQIYRRLPSWPSGTRRSTIPTMPLHAVEAALAHAGRRSRRSTPNSRRRPAATGDAPLALKIGIGINTGDCVVGNMGSESLRLFRARRRVNLASRLEGESKNYGVSLLLGERPRNWSRQHSSSSSTASASRASPRKRGSRPWCRRRTAETLALHQTLLDDLYGRRAGAVGPAFDDAGRAASRTGELLPQAQEPARGIAGVIGSDPALDELSDCIRRGSVTFFALAAGTDSGGVVATDWVISRSEDALS